MNDERTPLFTDLVEHAKRKKVSFHLVEGKWIADLYKNGYK
ncbi:MULTISPECIES: hypothetical protein [Bacillus cereus group]|nr:hypothetical protein [Bacillus cereus]